MNDKEKLEEAKRLYQTANADQRYVLESLFPELKESEDERIRRALVRFHKSTIDIDGIKGEEIIAWLEKQGEQNPADKVKPKFKVGDWVVWDNKIYCHVDNIYQGKESLMYTITDAHNMTRNYSVKGFDNNARLWTIKDAKDGDVLASGEVTFIFNKIHGVWLNCHCSRHNDGSLIADSYDLMIDKYFCEVHPATKEQRDLLFKKMAEAGYEWDEVNKKLRKIEKQGEQKPVDDLTPKQEWSESDKEEFQIAIDTLVEAGQHSSAHWLKSLKQRKGWKPSDEQMRALHDMNLTGDISYAGQGQTLIELYNDLKKLIE